MKKLSLIYSGAHKTPERNYVTMFYAIFTIALCNLLLFPMPASAQGVEQQSGALDKAAKGKIIDWLGEKLDEIYVFPDTAKSMAEFILNQYQNNQYEKAADIETFTQLLTGDLRSVYPDQHLKVSYDPSVGDAQQNSILDEERATRQKEQWRMNNFGFKKLEHLTGNVGYLKLDGFANSSWAREEAVGVMNFFANVDALIIDLRDNRGGHGNMVKLFMSYFFDEATQIGARYIRKDNRIEQAWTTDEVDGPKLSNIDLYILTSSNTFSAAEAFAFSLQNLNRATIIGEKTAGGGHTVETVSNTEFKITARIPDGRGLGKTFEGVGVEPDIKVPLNEAFNTAYVLALENLSKKKEGGMKNLLAWMAEYQKALFKPYTVDTKTLKKLAGTYKSLTVPFEGNNLYVIWPNTSDRLLLNAMSEDTYVVQGDPDIRLRFKLDESGQATAVYLFYSDGYQDEIPRSKK